jgi:hypothetical protein
MKKTKRKDNSNQLTPREAKRRQFTKWLIETNPKGTIVALRLRPDWRRPSDASLVKYALDYVRSAFIEAGLDAGARDWNEMDVAWEEGSRDYIKEALSEYPA